MKIMTPGSIPLFLSNSNIGETHEPVDLAPQIISFDVYYDSPLVVGFHVTDSLNNVEEED